MKMSSFLKRAPIAATVTGFALGVAATTAIGATTLGSSVFSDVPKGAYYDAAVGEMYRIGVIKGLDSNHFGPDDFVTRGQVAVMMQRLRADLVGNVSNDDDDDEGSVSSKASKASKASSAASTNSVPTSNRFGILRFTAGSVSIAENVAKVTLSVVRTSGDSGAISVKYETKAGTATDSDFEVSTGTLEFEDGETSKIFSINLKDDTSVESTENFQIVLSDAEGGAVVGNPGTVTINITDSESGSSNTNSSSSAGTNSNTSSSAGPQISFGAPTYSVRESSGSILITVVRTGSTSATMGVSYTTSNGSATASNFTAVNGTLSFAAGETSKTFSVAVANNSSVDGNKNFNVTLSTPTGGANLGVKDAVVTIVDDETTTAYGRGMLKMAKENYDVTESAGTLQITVQRIGGAAGVVNVKYRTNNLTAIGADDYAITTGTLTFAQNETSKIIYIPIYKDTTSDGGETFDVEIYDATDGATIMSPSRSTVTIDG